MTSVKSIGAIFSAIAAVSPFLEPIDRDGTRYQPLTKSQVGKLTKELAAKKAARKLINKRRKQKHRNKR